MLDHDRLFKELLGTFFVEFVDLFFPDLADLLERDSVVFLDKELITDVTAGEKVEADLVVKVRLRTQESFFLVHIETQSEAQSEFGYRMFRYFARLYEKHRLPIYPIAVFSFTEPKRVEPTLYQIGFPDFPVLQFNYRVVQLNRLDWRSYLKQPNPVAAALMAKMNITPAERAQVKLECLRMLATLKLNRARMQLISGFVDTYLSLTDAEIGRFAQELATIMPAEREQVMQIVTSWLQEGRQQEALTIVLRQLSRRVGELSPENKARVEALSVEELEQLSEALLDFAVPQDLQQWLDS